MNEELEQTPYSELIDKLFKCFFDKKPVPYSLYREFRDFQLIAVSDHRNVLERARSLVKHKDISDEEVVEFLEEKLNETWNEGVKEDETF